MITLICDINNKSFGDDKLRQFIMNKTSNSIDTRKYLLYMYLVSSQIPRINSLSAIVRIDYSK